MKKESQYRKCTYKYIDGTLCNRPITRQFLDKGSKLYCIFHIRNDEKLMQLKQQMLEEISKATNSFMKEVKANNYTEEKNKEEINKLRRKHILNYEGAYFPDGFDLFVNFTLEVGISFIKAIFNGQSVFSYTTFKGEIIFHEATFSGRADFYGATFSGRADFSGVIFSDKADFFVATFSVNAGFIGAIFSSKVDFSWATFSDVIYFSVATFNGEADFYGAIFIGAADFSWATFSNDAKFTNVFFIADTLFNGCHLDKGKLKILDTGFFLNCFFHDISEGSNISFINCCFSSVSFLRSRIADTIFSNCIFNMTEGWINKKIQKINSALESPHVAVINERLHQMTSLLEHKKDKVDKLKRRNKRLHKKNLLSEHRDFLKRPRFKLLMRKLSIRGLKIASSPLLHLFPRKFNSLRRKIKPLKETSNLMDFGEVRDNYMQLKVNMDRMKDYDLANDFYYGEMEMKRLGEKWYKLKRCFLSLYNTLSEYGNNPVRAMIMFFALIWIFSFPLFFMKLGIKDLSSQNKNQVSQNYVRLETGFCRNLQEMLSLSLYNMTALSNLTRSPYEPLDRCTFYYISLVQYIFRPVQIALIILAIRRKVKRGEE